MFNEQDYERAQQLSQREIDAGIARTRNAQASRKALSHCEECGDPIPLARQKAVNARLCIDCQTLKDKRGVR